MSEETENLFAALFALEDVREILRKTAPKHSLNEEEKKKAKEALDKAKKSIKKIEEKLL